MVALVVLLAVFGRRLPREEVFAYGFRQRVNANGILWDVSSFYHGG
ncbi:hypothetical protein JOD18_002485 [Gracilibacillus alcaliphilus]|nr:hypothetical protein [Gracilibacillus alcaliphilus]